MLNLLSLSPSVKNLIEKEIAGSRINNQWIETGGVIFHDRNDQNNIIFSTGPGPNSVRTPANFCLDANYISSQISLYLGTNNLFAGTWHAHISNPALTVASQTDLTYFSNLSTSFNVALVHLIVAAPIPSSGVCRPSHYKFFFSDDKGNVTAGSECPW